MSDRENWIDWTKAILIWLMVLGHARLNGILLDFVYAFHMPAFFVISGYLYKPHNFIHTIKSFGIPIIFFSSINLLIVLMNMYRVGEPIVFPSILSRIIPPFYKNACADDITLFRGVWFVVVLFLMRLLMGDLPWLSSTYKNIKWITILLIIYVTIEPYLLSRYAIYFQQYYCYKVICCLPFMMIGIIIKKHKNKILSLSVFPLCILLIVFITISLWNGYTDIWKYHFGKNYIFFYVTALSASIILFNLCRKLKSNQIITTLSEGTLLTLGLHTPIIRVCNKIYESIEVAPSCLISSLIVMITSYCLTRLILKYCPILIGK